MTIGLKDLYYAIITMQDGVENYGEPKKLAEALNADLSVNVAEAKLYADDALSESAKEFVDGSLKLGIKELTPEVIQYQYLQYLLTYRTSQLTVHLDTS